MSFAEQPVLKRQSAHVTTTRPLASIEADGSGPERISAGSVKAVTEATKTAAFQVVPPSVDRQAIIDSIDADPEGTMTVPLG
jgi:hypothetical protein